MKRLFILLLCAFILMLGCGCRDKQTDDDTSSDIQVVLPLDDTVNGYRQEGIKEKLRGDSGDTEQSEETEGYYVNTKTKKFHKLSCTYAKKGSQNGIWRDADRDSLISEGYFPCSKCEP